jgi:hypothetical protein
MAYFVRPGSGLRASGLRDTPGRLSVFVGPVDQTLFERPCGFGAGIAAAGSKPDFKGCLNLFFAHHLVRETVRHHEELLLGSRHVAPVHSAALPFKS